MRNASAIQQRPLLALAACGALAAFALLGSGGAAASCVSLSGSSFCEAEYGFHKYGVDSDTSAFFTALRAYFNGRAPRERAEQQGPLVTTAAEFDVEIQRLLDDSDTTNLFSGCNVPKDKIQFLRPFLCNWAIHHAVECGRNSEPVICATGMDALFQSVAKTLDNRALCPNTERTAANRRVAALRSAYSSDRVAARYFNGATNCIVESTDAESYPMCGYGSCSASKEMGCKRTCSSFSIWVILLIIAGVVLLLLLLGLITILCLMNRAKKRLGDTSDARTKWDGKSGSKRNARFSELPKPVSQSGHGAPIVNVSIPDTPFNLGGGNRSAAAAAGRVSMATSVETEQSRQNSEARKFVGRTVRAIGSFVPDLPDELAVMEGDWLHILEVFEDNWASVHLLRAGDDGRSAAYNRRSENVLSTGLVPVFVFAPGASGAHGANGANGARNSALKRTSSIEAFSRNSRYDQSSPLSFMT